MAQIQKTLLPVLVTLPTRGTNRWFLKATEVVLNSSQNKNKKVPLAGLCHNAPHTHYDRLVRACQKKPSSRAVSLLLLVPALRSSTSLPFGLHLWLLEWLGSNDATPLHAHGETETLVPHQVRSHLVVESRQWVDSKANSRLNYNEYWYQSMYIYICIYMCSNRQNEVTTNYIVEYNAEGSTASLHCYACFNSSLEWTFQNT